MGDIYLGLLVLAVLSAAMFGAGRPSDRSSCLTASCQPAESSDDRHAGGLHRLGVGQAVAG